MAKVTALKKGQLRNRRVRVWLDGRSAFSLEVETVANERLRVGQELSPGEIEAIKRADLHQRCLNAALRYLSYRPRSESELKQRLHQRGFDDASIEKVIARLAGQGLVNDAAFAQFWKEDRQSFSPRSQRLIRLELKRKGVAEGLIDEAVEGVDDEESAYRMAQSRSRSLLASDYQSFRSRLGGYLRRRGFGYEVINKIIEQVWQEKLNSQSVQRLDEGVKTP